MPTPEPATPPVNQPQGLNDQAIAAMSGKELVEKWDEVGKYVQNAYDTEGNIFKGGQ